MIEIAPVLDQAVQAGGACSVPAHKLQPLSAL